MLDNVYILEIPKKEKLEVTVNQDLYAIKYFDIENPTYTYESFYEPKELNDILNHKYHIRTLKRDLLADGKHLVEMKYIKDNKIIYKANKEKLIKMPYKRTIPEPYDFEYISQITKMKQEKINTDYEEGFFKKRYLK